MGDDADESVETAGTGDSRRAAGAGEADDTPPRDVAVDDQAIKWSEHFEKITDMFWKGGSYIIGYTYAAGSCVVAYTLAVVILAVTGTPSGDNHVEVIRALIDHSVYFTVAAFASVTVVASSFFLGLYMILSFLAKRGKGGTGAGEQ